METNPKEMATIVIRDGQVYMPEVKSTAYWDTWPITFSQVRDYVGSITLS